MTIPNQVTHRNNYRKQKAQGLVQQNPPMRGANKNGPQIVAPPPQRAKRQVAPGRSLAEQLGLIPTQKPLVAPAVSTEPKVFPEPTAAPTDPAPAAPIEAATAPPLFETLSARSERLQEPEVTDENDLGRAVESNRPVSEVDAEEEAEEDLPPINEAVEPAAEPAVDLGPGPNMPEFKPLI